ncbi:hypothetical protein [Marinimicrobium sp. ABcell2]|uniref:hypothetical protein n=1 Tax=Marinimicrobium sp. ABcell2 TaxID=3069751 RepID=UPI0027ADF4BB|nr:hypothetical protein [Marinimicrobium sp. ABcell2]MDQ2076755.1 hypothetical protein [Marinimicrobium sp. ABcell2]
MFSLRRKGDYRLQLTRTLKNPGQYTVELYLFTPYEGKFSEWTLSEQQFFFNSLEHRFRLLGLPDKKRISKSGSSFALLSPHYEIQYGSWLFQYRASMDHLRQQILGAELAAEPVKRALRLIQNFAQRLRKSNPERSSHIRYFRLVDVYFSWHAEQFLLECMTMEGYSELNQELRDSIRDFLQQEYRYRREMKYLPDFRGTPTRLWNRMSLYLRLLEFPVVLRSKVVELGSGTRKLVKAGSTMMVMSLITYFLFNARASTQQLSLALLLGIALAYALRDLLRDDMIARVTSWLRKGKPRWKVRLQMPYTNKLLAVQSVWLDYRKLPDLPQQVLEHSGTWTSNEERQIICYRSMLNLDKAALEQDQIQERLSLDCEELCAMIQAARNKVFTWADEDDPMSPVEAHPIEKQHDYDLLLVCSEDSTGHSSAQRWRLRLGTTGIVKCENKKTHWPSPEEQQKKNGLARLRDSFRRR